MAKPYTFDDPTSVVAKLNELGTGSAKYAAAKLLARHKEMVEAANVLSAPLKAAQDGREWFDSTDDESVAEVKAGVATVQDKIEQAQKFIEQANAQIARMIDEAVASRTKSVVSDDDIQLAAMQYDEARGAVASIVKTICNLPNVDTAHGFDVKVIAALGNNPVVTKVQEGKGSSGSRGGTGGGTRDGWRPTFSSIVLDGTPLDKPTLSALALKLGVNGDIKALVRSQVRTQIADVDAEMVVGKEYFATVTIKGAGEENDKVHKIVLTAGDPTRKGKHEAPASDEHMAEL